MLKMKDVALLDIGSSRIDFLYGSMNGNNMDVVASSSANYSGFSDGEFFEEDKLVDIIGGLVREVENKVGKRVLKKVYVAVPGEFIMVDVKKVQEQFPKPRAVTNNDWDRLIDRAETSSNTDDYVNIASNGLIFEADSYKPLNSRSDDEVVTRSIMATVSCVLCSRKFISLFGDIFNELDIKEAEYFSASFAEAMYLTTKQERDKGVLLCDIGYLTTTVMLVKGNGIMDIRSFSRGGGHMIADLIEAYGIDFKSADSLYHRINLKVDASDGDMYRFNMPDGIAGLPMNEVNEIACYELDILVKYINKCIDCFGDKVNDFMPIFFTGGGLSPVKGAMDYVAHSTNRKFHIRKPNVMQYRDPWYSSLVSGFCLANIKERNSNVVRKFFNKLFGG